MSSRTLLAALLLPALGACATISARPERVKTVKSVAVVGYTAVWDVSAKTKQKEAPVGSRVNAIKSITRSATGEAQAEREERAQASYDKLVDTLEEKMSWTVLDRSALEQSDAYKARVNEGGPHPGGGMFSPDNRYLFVEGVLRQEDVRRMSVEERRAMMDALKVDAIAFAFVRFNVVESGFALGGVGNMKQYPVATVEFQLCDRDSDEPIWEDRSARGRRAEKMMSQDVAGVSVQREAVEAVVEAAGYGYEELIARFQQYQP